ncbi:SgrR family transcriptional regulator [Hazenella coriacea]|uniref:MarR-like DNA-binding transcriptional regulator SgrR of sgrS sRNA n=1 Tax=Hazenella coriacea TaxID=1179467 RepID=A0A4V2UUY0_9BACL|nr:ABC transporter substrate-binding protein [Hazenella coriacea]TCS93627.1 MarR-like DNA-binding transcriptional regulator SgrR of sgrS sRNA [Hazenella coriacea]
MKDLSYFQMRAYLFPREEQQTASFRLEELESVWFCTRKNVKRKIKKYVEEGKCIYQPGKGRGNASCLTFTNSFQNEVEKEVRENIEQDQLDHLIQLLQLSIPRSWIADISKEVQALFGLQSHQSSKDVLRTIFNREISTIDPLYSSVAFESHLIRQLGDSLVTYDEEKDQILPHLAHHWNGDKQGLTWTFYLRKGVRFHHQGILTSEDVRYTYQRFQSTSSPLHWLVKDIRAIDCPSPYVIQFHLHKRNPFFLRYVSSINLAILPRDVPFDEYQWIGTGPFQLKERTDTKLVLEAFDSYFSERPFLDKIEFWRVPVEAARIMTYQLEGKEWSETPPPIREVENGFRFLAFNFRKPSIVQNRHFREALYHLLDLKKMWKDLGRKNLIEATSFYPTQSKVVVKDPTLVETFLCNSGYQGETLTLYALDYLRAVEEAEWFRKEAEKFGIRLKLVHFNFDRYYQLDLDQDADLVFLGEVASTDIHLSFLSAFYNEALIFRRFLAPEHLQIIEHWLKKFKHEPQKQKREHWISQVESFLRDDYLILFKHHPIKTRIFHPMIQNIHFESFGHVDFRKLWIE